MKTLGKHRARRLLIHSTGSLAGNCLTLIEGGSRFVFAWLAFNRHGTIHEGAR